MTEKTGKERRTDVDEWLDEMRASAAAIERYIDGLSEERFTQEEMRQDAVVRRLEMIGEAADRIMKADPEYAKNLPGIALVEAKRMRNFVIHGYDQVNIRTCRGSSPKSSYPSSSTPTKTLIRLPPKSWPPSSLPPMSACASIPIPRLTHCGPGWQYSTVAGRNIIVGNGSDELLALATRAFVQPSMAQRHPPRKPPSNSSRPVIHCMPVLGGDQEKSEIEIGWTFLARSHWGGVYNQEMKHLMLRHAFKFVKRVIFLVGPQNLRSQRAMEKIGGVRVGSKSDAAGRMSFIYQITAPT